MNDKNAQNINQINMGIINDNNINNNQNQILIKQSGNKPTQKSKNLSSFMDNNHMNFKNHIITSKTPKTNNKIIKKINNGKIIQNILKKGNNNINMNLLNKNNNNYLQILIIMNQKMILLSKIFQIIEINQKIILIILL